MLLSVSLQEENLVSTNTALWIDKGGIESVWASKRNDLRGMIFVRFVDHIERQSIQTTFFFHAGNDRSG